MRYGVGMLSIAAIAEVLLLVGTPVGSGAESPGEKIVETKKARIPLHLSAPAREGLQLTMREHLEALQAIVAALAIEDYEKAAAVAHEDLGFPKHHQAMQREQGAPFPPKYQELAMAHHRMAEELAQIIPSKDMKKILPHLDRTMKACVACHQAYKL
jgi:hypothetical protein